jgi:regulator of nucleoside diphosphate kinase
MSYLQQELPPITLSAGECDRLRRLVDAAADPSQKTVAFWDDSTMKVRRVILVYPNEADVDAGKISVMTPIGAALIGLSVGQSIEWELPSGGWRSLTVLDVAETGPNAA